MKRKLPPDTRPDYRDPNMPVLIQVEDDLGERHLESFPSHEVRAAMKVWFDSNTEAHWSQDPTYNLRRKK